MTRASQELGQQGEQLAADHLKRKGARLLARNYRSSLGELDLVMEHEGDLVGVEVKTRRPGQPGLPEEAVNRVKMERLERLLAQFADETDRAEAGWRIDVVAIEITPEGRVVRLEHIRDAYG